MESTAKPRTNKALEGFDKLPDSAFVRVETVSALIASRAKSIFQRN